MDEAQPEVLMLRNVLATTAHDLGGLASALLLRADVLEHGSSDATVRAMRSIAGELRLIGQQLRALRSEDAHGSLAPTPDGPGTQWSARVTRFGVGLLPRGSAIQCTVNDEHIPRSVAHPLWNIILALFGALGENSPHSRVSVRIMSELQVRCSVLTVDATQNGQPVELEQMMSGPWWQWALSQAERYGLTLSADKTMAVVTCPLDTNA